jgi:plastocyanin
MAQEKGAAYKEVDVKDGGTIVGTVKFDGDVPSAKMLKVDKDEQTCGHENKASEELVVNGESKGVKNVVVSLVDIAAGKKIEAVTAVLDQKECLFTPHVIAIPVGSSVDLLNSDNVMHNLHSWSIKNPAFNEGVSGKVLRSLLLLWDLKLILIFEATKHFCLVPIIADWVGLYLILLGKTLAYSL